MAHSSKARRNQYNKEWYAINKKRLNAYQRRYYAKNKVKLRARMRTRYAAKGEAARVASRRWYRNSVLRGNRPGRRYPAPTRRPTTRCECCRRPVRTPHLDHDRRTHRFRGWLCMQCNVGIGMLGDSLRGVRRAVRYLERT